MNLRSLLIACAAAGVASHEARADRRELYLSGTLEPAVLSLRDSQGGGASSSVFGFGGALSTSYGLTDSLHLGAIGRLSVVSNAAFGGITAMQADGTTARGTLYEDALFFSLGAVGRYRYDSGGRWAPFAEAEISVSLNRYSNVALIPDDASINVPLRSVSAVGVGARATIGAEYRLDDRWALGLGFAVQLNAGGLRPWQLALPLTFSWIH